MKVLYDHQTFSLQDYGGISRIYTELIRSSPNNEVKTELSLLFSNNLYLRELSKTSHLNFFESSNWKYKVPLAYKVNKQYSIYKIKNNCYDLFHPTYYDPYFLKYLKGKPFVVTVHDTIHEVLADRNKKFRLDKIMEGKKILVKEAARIITVSQSTKNDVIKMFEVDENKIDVISLASSISRAHSVKVEKVIAENYLLFLGNRRLYKNFSFFLEAIVPLLSEQKEIVVICGGGGKFTEQEKLLIEKYGLQGRVLQLEIKNDTTLTSLYSNAICFIFPSLYEGFGIPVLEAFSCGCACALSDRSSLPEVGGNAAVYFNPEDAQSIYSVISRLISDRELRLEKIRRGYHRIKLFSWDKTRERTFQVYKSLV